MADYIVVAIMVSIVTVLGVILSNNKATSVMTNEVKRLTEEVAYHNNFARRMPLVEEQIKELTKRVERLERSKHG